MLMGAELPLSAIRSQVASALDILVHLGRLRDRSRRVLSIVEVDEVENGEIRLNPLFGFEEEETEGGENTDGHVRGGLKKTGTLVHREKLRAAGVAL